MRVPKKFEPFFNDPLTHNIFEGGRGGGKTRTIISIIVEVMRKAPLNVLCCREVQKSLKESSYLGFEQEIQRKGYGDYFTLKEGVIESHTGGRAIFIGLLQHTVESIKSYEGYHWAWIEEAQSISKKSLDVLIPTLRTDGHFKVDIGREFIFPLCMFLYSLNPFSYLDPINQVLPESRSDVRRIKINHNDNPWFPEALEKERQEAEKIMSPEEYARIWEGVPFQSSERSIFALQEVKDAMARTVEKGDTVVGVDVARFGQDATVMIKRKGMQVVDIKKFHKLDTQTVARTAFSFAEYGQIVVDDSGVGGGVTDKLREMGAKVRAVNFGSKARDPKKYPDIISEMWFNLKEKINIIGLPDDSELLFELTNRQFSYTPDDRRRVERKEEYKKRTGRGSPDSADALILCYYSTVGISDDLRKELFGHG